MQYCEDCKWMHQHFWKDKAICEKTRKPTEATDRACEAFEAPEAQTRMEV